MTESAALEQAAPAAAVPVVREDKMPDGVKYIVANEFAERFCYYGISSILTLYMVQFLRFGEADATAFSSLFQGSAYFFPLVGAIVSDVFWGKYKTIITFSLVYATGCLVVAFISGAWGLRIGLFLVAFGTGGIKPCVSTNVGDQFTSKNQHLIERAFSLFYLAINAGSTVSIFFCPVLLAKYGPMPAFGMPAVMMLMATFAFWLGRKKFAVVPPAGKAWLKEVLSPVGLKTIGSLAIIYLFVAMFWSLWNQSSGQTWTLQARSSLMDKSLGFGMTLLPAQIQVVNGPCILLMVPLFTYLIYPGVGKIFKVTPLRKITVGFFTVASSFLIVSWIEGQIQSGHRVSVWWQILAYGVLSAAEVLVSITCLEFSYKQAPLRMKSFIMAMFLASSALGSFITAGVNYAMIRPVVAESAESGQETWVKLADASGFVAGQKIDFDGDTGLMVEKADGTRETLKGTYLVFATDPASNRLQLMDPVDRKPLTTSGTFDAGKAKVTTYRLVGPEYFNFFALVMACMGVIFIFVAILYKEQTHVREEAPAAA
jgi:POT family proton-dependent oligopeptide transporter